MSTCPAQKGAWSAVALYLPRLCRKIVTRSCRAVVDRTTYSGSSGGHAAVSSPLSRTPQSDRRGTYHQATPGQDLAGDGFIARKALAFAGGPELRRAVNRACMTQLTRRRAHGYRVSDQLFLVVRALQNPSPAFASRETCPGFWQDGCRFSRNVVSIPSTAAATATSLPLAKAVV